MQLTELTLEQLLAQSEPATHAGIINLFKSSDVHYLVVCCDETEERRGLIAVGPSQDIKSFEDLDGLDFEGVRPAYFVRTQIMLRKRNTRAATRKSQLVQEEMESQAEFEETTGPAEKSPQVQALLDENPTLQSLQQHLEEEFAKVQEKMQELKKREQELANRERFVTDAEDRLNRLTEQFMERENSLQKRELALQKKEKEFYAQRFESAVKDVETKKSAVVLI